MTRKGFVWKAIAIDECMEGVEGIDSLVTAEDGAIYGGIVNGSGILSRERGNGHLLFRYDPETNTVEDLGVTLIDSWTPTEQFDRANVKFHHSLDFSSEGKLYGATGALHGFKHKHFRYTDIEGGHLIRFDPATKSSTDLGVVKPHEFVFASVIDKKRDRFYAITFPMNHFLVYDIATGKINDKGQLKGPWGGTTHDIACDKEGNVYGSYDGGCLFKYDSSEDELIETEVKLPGGEKIDTLNLDEESGLLYGGTMESGYLFSFDPDEEKVRCLGRPVKREGRMSVIAGGDGRVLGVAGVSALKFFVYNLSTDKIKDLGIVKDEEKKVIGWLSHAIALGRDGTLYIGETDRYPYFYMVDTRMFHYNPTYGFLYPFMDETIVRRDWTKAFNLHNMKIDKNGAITVTEKTHTYLWIGRAP